MAMQAIDGLRPWNAVGEEVATVESMVSAEQWRAVRRGR